MATRVPEASVILPAYNAERYLARTIESVLAQDHGDFELLMLDDGSTDRTLEIMHRFADRDARCMVRTRPNCGIITTRNEALQLARADILLLIDADDICRPGRFRMQLDYLARHPDCVAVGSEAMLVDPDGRPLRVQGVPLTHAEIDAAHMQGEGGMIINPSAALRRPAVLQVGGYHEFPYAEDFDLFLRLAEIGQLANLPDVLVEYRQHFKSVSHSNKALQLHSTEQSIREAHLRRGTVDTRTPASTVAEQVPVMTAGSISRRWAWWALAAGNTATARWHCFNAIRHEPFTSENYRLLGCALRGR